MPLSLNQAMPTTTPALFLAPYLDTYLSASFSLLSHLSNFPTMDHIEGIVTTTRMCFGNLIWTCSLSSIKLCWVSYMQLGAILDIILAKPEAGSSWKSNYGSCAFSPSATLGCMANIDNQKEDIYKGIPRCQRP